MNLKLKKKKAEHEITALKNSQQHFLALTFSYLLISITITAVIF